MPPQEGSSLKGRTKGVQIKLGVPKLPGSIRLRDLWQLLSGFGMVLYIRIELTPESSSAVAHVRCTDPDIEIECVYWKGKCIDVDRRG